MAAEKQAYEPTNQYETMGFKDLSEFKETKTRELNEIFEKAPDMKMSEDTVKEIRARNTELGEATKRWETLRELDSTFIKIKEDLRRANQPNHLVPFPGGGYDGAIAQRYQGKSLGEQFTESDEFKSLAKDGERAQFRLELPDAEVKTTLTEGTSYAVYPPRMPGAIESAQRRPVVADLIPQTPTTSPTIIYMEETTFTNNAAPVAENAAKPESVLAWTQRTQTVEVIATYIPMTNQLRDDVPSMQSTVNNRLGLMLDLAEESQLLSGSGSTPALMGFYNKSGIQTQAKGTDPVPDAIFKAFTKIRFTGYAEPTGVVLHPNDWQDVRLLRTLDGIYIFGNPADAAPERLFGKTVVVTPAATENTGLAGDFQLYSELFRRMGKTIVVGFINDDLVKNKQTILIEERVALVIYRAAAFATITGI